MTVGVLFKQLKAFELSNAVLSTIAVLVRGNTTEDSELQSLKAARPIVVAVAGMGILVRPVLLKAY